VIHAFVWSNGLMQDLPADPNADSTAQSINASGRIAGTLGATVGLWDRGDARSLGDLGVFGLQRITINNRGDILAEGYHGYQDTHSFIWDGKHWSEILGPAGEPTIASALTNSGSVAGGMQPSPAGFHAFLWKRGTTTDLGALSGGDGFATALNASDDVVGYSRLASGRYHAFIWTRPTGMVDLGTLGGDTSWAYAVSDGGMVVGYSQPPGCTVSCGDVHATIWTRG
jgi:probable HAF family extracellular repeat protein